MKHIKEVDLTPQLSTKLFIANKFLIPISKELRILARNGIISKVRSEVLWNVTVPIKERLRLELKEYNGTK